MLHCLLANGGCAGQSVPFLCGNNYLLQFIYIGLQVVDALFLGAHRKGFVADIGYSDRLIEAVGQDENAVLVGYGNNVFGAFCHDGGTYYRFVGAFLQYFASYLSYCYLEK